METDVEQILDQMVEDMLDAPSRFIAVNPDMHSISGSPVATMFLQAVYFRWKQTGCKPFYKFARPCNHRLYRDGDSWAEELNIKRSQFEAARDEVATKFTGELAQEKTKAEVFATSLVIYWTDASHVTWYDFNLALLKRRMKEMARSKLKQRIAKRAGQVPAPTAEPESDGDDLDLINVGEPAVANAENQHQETVVADAENRHHTNAGFVQQTDAENLHSLITYKTEKTTYKERDKLSLPPEILNATAEESKADPLGLGMDASGMISLDATAAPSSGEGVAGPKQVAPARAARPRAAAPRSGKVGKPPAPTKGSVGKKVRGNGLDEIAREGSPVWPMMKVLEHITQIAIEDKRKMLAGAADSLLKRGYTPEQIQAWYGDPKGWWYTFDWRGRRGELPGIASINETLYRAKNNIDPSKGKKIVAAKAGVVQAPSAEDREAKAKAERAKGLEQIVANNPQVYGPKLFAQEQSRPILLEVFNRRPDLLEKACAASPALREMVAKANGGPQVPPGSPSGRMPAPRMRGDGHKLPEAKPRLQLDVAEDE